MTVLRSASAQRAGFYRMIWRWHFYAGLFVIPFILVLASTGAIYLFKPQIDRWEERAFRDLPGGSASPVAQVEAALARYPGARFDSYRVPLAPGDAALVHIGFDGDGMRDVFVGPRGSVVGVLDPEARISATIARIHGSLLLGRFGDWLVELAASWAIVMILTGLYLWWPRGRGLAGVVWPRRRALLRDLHAVTGFWVAGLALVLLASGLPWAGVWGNAFRMVRAELGWVNAAPPDWKLRTVAAEHAAHDHAAMMAGLSATPSLDLLPAMVSRARAEELAFPALVKPPGAIDGHGAARRASTEWIVKSEAQNRTLVRSIRFDGEGREVGRSDFADKHPIDRAINYGIAWHEGQLFGWVNQTIGVATALALLTLAVTSVLLWLRRRPGGALGAPLQPAVPARMGGVAAIVFMLALLLPLLALSLVALLLVEFAILRRIAPVARWLGLRAAPA